MPDVCYGLSKDVSIDKFEEGILLTIKTSPNVVCLGEFEGELLNLVIENSLGQVANLLSNKYEGDTIERDLVDFCEKLCQTGVLCKMKQW